MQIYGRIGFALALGLMVADAAQFSLMQFSDASCATGYTMSTDYKYLSTVGGAFCLEINAVNHDMTVPNHPVFYTTPMQNIIEKWEVSCETSSGKVKINTYGNCDTACAACNSTAYGKYEFASGVIFTELMNSGACKTVAREITSVYYVTSTTNQYLNATSDGITWPSDAYTCAAAPGSSAGTTTSGNASSGTTGSGLTSGEGPSTVPPFMAMMGLVAMLYSH